MEGVFKNVFVLNTGRCGSTTFAEACKHISNYTAAHESHAWVIGNSRLQYPPHHIEVDHGLSWMLGQVDQLYGDQAFYVHLIRDKEKVVSSSNKLWDHSFNAARFFAEGILGNVPELLSEADRRTVSSQLFDVKTSGILLFLRDKTNVITIDIDDPVSGYTEFWQQIGAEGNLEAALNEFKIKHNASLTSPDAAAKDQAFKRELREKIMRKRIKEARTRTDRWKRQLQFMLFKLTGLHSDLF